MNASHHEPKTWRRWLYVNLHPPAWHKRGLSPLNRLVAHRRDDLRMAVAGVENGDAAGEIDIAPVLHVPEFRAFGALGEHRIGGADAAWNGRLPAGLER